ncbi:hypothetical protein [Pseudonocardia kunmingensis]|uniref:hypothetical protein n=1 Tax=Pseudonocardia kunmingensis TaxID=630975 RepID=UPI0014797EAE|nr:hypothetical protein [Pseudonocardia kunmingensis]
MLEAISADASTASDSPPLARSSPPRLEGLDRAVLWKLVCRLARGAAIHSWAPPA